jgi:hypothetical protein
MFSYPNSLLQYPYFVDVQEVSWDLPKFHSQMNSDWSLSELITIIPFPCIAIGLILIR